MLLTLVANVLGTSTSSIRSTNKRSSISSVVSANSANKKVTPAPNPTQLSIPEKSLVQDASPVPHSTLTAESNCVLEINTFISHPLVQTARVAPDTVADALKPSALHTADEKIVQTHSINKTASRDQNILEGAHPELMKQVELLKSRTLLEAIRRSNDDDVTSNKIFRELSSRNNNLRVSFEILGDRLFHRGGGNGEFVSFEPDSPLPAGESH